MSPGVRQALWGMMLLTVLVNAASMFTPIINEGDSVLYAALAQHMVDSGDWLSLVLDGKDWLDKPHFPFWVGALFFKLLGISAGTYILPGFLFHLLGGYYCYRIARLHYGRDVACIALLVYLSTYHVMYTTSALKAEAFLTGTIMGACYHCLRLDATGKLKHVVLAALCAACAVMTKGIFTLITIGSGLVCLWAYQGRLANFFQARWWLVLALTALFIAPELVALYVQFDSHPEKVVFGQQGVSGIRFFLWDSQFGRFFNSGPIKNQEGNPWYFLHVFAWAFLPWVAAFCGAFWTGLRGFGSKSIHEREAFVYLAGSFFITFILFSATAFQLDYYTVIVYPFAAIFCAKFLSDGLALPRAKALCTAQVIAALLTLVLALTILIQVANQTLLALLVVAALAGLVLGWIFGGHHRATVLFALPVLAVNLLYAGLEGMTFIAHSRYSVPYNALPALQTDVQMPVVVYGMDSIVTWEIGLYRRSAPSLRVDQPQDLPPQGNKYFLIAKSDALPLLASRLGAYRVVQEGRWVDHKTGTLPRQMNLARGTETLEAFSILRVGAEP